MISRETNKTVKIEGDYSVIGSRIKIAYYKPEEYYSHLDILFNPKEPNDLISLTVTASGLESTNVSFSLAASQKIFLLTATNFSSFIVADVYNANQIIEDLSKTILKLIPLRQERGHTNPAGLVSQIRDLFEKFEVLINKLVTKHKDLNKNNDLPAQNPENLDNELCEIIYIFQNECDLFTTAIEREKLKRQARIQEFKKGIFQVNQGPITVERASSPVDQQLELRTLDQTKKTY